GGSGQRACFPEEEAQLYEWVMSVHQDDLAVTYLNLRVKITEILSKSAKQTQNITKRAIIANIDKTPVWFNMAGSLTINPKGMKTVHVRTTGNDKNCFIVVLTYFADGTRFSLVIIFKGKVWPANTLPPLASVIIWFQEKGWMDELEWRIE
ncbi:43376_t:CDS:2, partial [Gigaspora margarita]